MNASSNIFSLKILLVLVCIGLFSSCRYFSDDRTKQDPIAKVYDYYLTAEDLEGVVPAGSSKADSVTVVKSYIENWIRQKSVLHKAEKNLGDDKKNVSKQLEEYRNSLITYAYEKELIRQKLDTNVGENEIASFYKSHLSNFELKDNIIKVIYLKLSKKSPKLEKAKAWYRSDDPKDRKLLEEYCHQYAVNYFLDDNTWLLFDDLLKEIPIKTYDKEQFLQNNRNIEIEDSSLIYLVNIRGFMIKNSTSPMSFEKKNITTMIMNERKIRLIEDMERQAYEDSKKNGVVEIY